MNSGEFIAGGYFLTRPVARDDAYMATELLPPTLFSLSGCLADFALEYWWSDENVDGALAFGVGEDRLSGLVRWYRDRFGERIGAPNVAFSLEVIDEFVTEFVGDVSDLVILGCGLSVEHRALLLDRRRVAGDDGEYGVVEMLDRNMALEPGGEALGFEPMSYQYGLECSWLCNQLEQAAEAEVDLRPDPSTGFVAGYDEAVDIVGYINRDDVGAEPGTWLPWLVVRYPISAGSIRSRSITGASSIDRTEK